MASTFSNLKIQLMETGENAGTWGNTTNANLGTAIEQALVETATVTFASADVTLTLTDSNSAQNARALRLNLGGTTGGARDLIVPAIQKPYIVNNGTADIITIKNAAGTGIAVPAGKSFLVYNNGTNVVNALDGISVESGGTGLNTLTNNNVIIGNAAAAVKFVGPGTSGNVLTSDGTVWASVAPPAAPAAIPSGTVMLFAQTAAPTGFTKNTSTGDNHALRIVTGTAGTGGTVDFSTAFASQTPTGSVALSGGSVGNTTLSTPQIPSHTHDAARGLATPSGFSARGPDVSSLTTGATGGGGAHNHPFSGQSATFSGNAINLAVKFVDVIRATKD